MDKDLYKDLYQAFEDAKADFITAGVPPIAIIDRFRGQPLNPEQYEYYPLPAIFIERSTEWLREGNVYNGITQLGFHLVTEPTWDTSSISTNKDAGLEYFDLVDQVRIVLDGFRKSYISSFFRTKDDPIDTGVVMYERLGYQCIYYANTPLKPNYADSNYGNDVQILGRKVKTRNA